MDMARNNSDDTRGNAILVIGRYDFSGKNNDELSFLKNDIITVIQQLDGGWWEGTTSDGRIGWFPSNFVGVVNLDSDMFDSVVDNSSNNFFIDYKKNRWEIFSMYSKNESEHLNMLEKINKEIYPELKRSSSEEENHTFFLVSVILEFTKNLLQNVENEIRRPLIEQQPGKIFLDSAQKFFDLLKKYCEVYSSAVESLNSRSKEVQPILARKRMQLNDFIVELSLVYRHVMKYSNFLQELETNTPETHFDRGNLQRACSVYRDFYTFCEEIRKQKEAQRDFLKLSSSIIFEKFGKDMHKELGQFLHIGKVTISPVLSKASLNGALNSIVDRCLAIFEMKTFIFQQNLDDCSYKLNYSFSNNDLVVYKNESTNSFKLSIFGSEEIKLRSSTANDFQKVSEAFDFCLKSVFICNSNDEPQHDSHVQSSENFRRRGVIEQNANSKPTTTCGMFQVNYDLEMIFPEPDLVMCDKAANSSHKKDVHKNNEVLKTGGKLYSGWCLRPYPTIRSEFSLTVENIPVIKLRRDNVCLNEHAEDDAIMLKIVEGYCTNLGSMVPSTSRSSNDRNAWCCSTQNQCLRNSDESTNYFGQSPRRAASYPNEYRPQLIVAEDEKLFVEELENDQLVLKEREELNFRTLVDTVYSLRDQLTALQKEFHDVVKTLENEQKVRRRLEEHLRLKLGGTSINSALTKYSSMNSEEGNRGSLSDDNAE